MRSACATAMVLAAACRFDATPPPNAHLTCSTSADCPQPLVCRLGVCVNASDIDSTGPSIASVTFSRTIVRPGVSVDVALTASKSLFHPPLLRASSGSRELTAQLSGSGASFGGALQLPADWPEGVTVVRATLVDLSGNTADELAGTLTVDASPPSVLPETVVVRLTPDADAGVAQVTQLGPHVTLGVTFTFDEAVVPDAGLSGGAACALDNVAGNTFSYACRVAPVSQPMAPLMLQVTAADLAGNVLDGPLPGLNVTVKTAPPASPLDTPQAGLVLRRSPYGAAALVPQTQLVVPPGVVSEGGTLFVFDANGQVLASGLTGPAGSQLSLGALDQLSVSALLVDPAANASPLIRVRNGVLELAFGGSSVPNVLRAFATAGSTSEQGGETSRASETVGRLAPLSSTGGWTWVQRAGPQPCGTVSGGYDRRRGRAVIYADCNFGPTAWEFDGETWLQVPRFDLELDGEPNVNGVFVQDDALDALVYVDTDTVHIRLWEWLSTSARLITLPGDPDAGRSATALRNTVTGADYDPVLGELVVVGSADPPAYEAPICYASTVGWRCTLPGSAGLSSIPVRMAPIPGTGVQFAAAPTGRYLVDGDGGVTKLAGFAVGPVVVDPQRQQLLMLSSGGQQAIALDGDGGARLADAGTGLYSLDSLLAYWDEGASTVRVVDWHPFSNLALYDVVDGGVSRAWTQSPQTGFISFVGPTGDGRVMYGGGNPTATAAFYPVAGVDHPVLGLTQDPLEQWVAVNGAPVMPQHLSVLGFDALVLDGGYSVTLGSGATPPQPVFYGLWGGTSPRAFFGMNATGSAISWCDVSAAYDAFVAPDAGSPLAADPDGGLLMVNASESFVALTVPWPGWAFTTWNASALPFGTCSAPNMIYHSADITQPLQGVSVPLDAPEEPARPVYSPVLDALVFLQHGTSSVTLLASDGGFRTYPIGDPEPDGEPPSRALECQYNRPSGEWVTTEQRIASTSLSGDLWELVGVEQRPSQLAVNPLSAVQLPAGATLSAVQLSGVAGGSGSGVDGVEADVWDQSAWRAIGQTQDSFAAPAAFTFDVTDATQLARVLNPHAKDLRFRFVSRGLNGTGAAQLTTQGVMVQINYRSP